jgi:hypothetical protein
VSGSIDAPVEGVTLAVTGAATGIATATATAAAGAVNARTLGVREVVVVVALVVLRIEVEGVVWLRVWLTVGDVLAVLTEPDVALLGAAIKLGVGEPAILAAAPVSTALALDGTGVAATD